MKGRFRLIPFAGALWMAALVFVGVGQAAEKVKGKVSKVEKTAVTILDSQNHEKRMTTDSQTKIEGTLSAGVMVEAEVNDKGHALSIRVVSETPKAGEPEKPENAKPSPEPKK